MEPIKQFQAQLDESQRIVFFSGAGVSTASGIPDFRSSSGIFVQEAGYQFSPEEIISHSFYKTHPQVFFEFYFDKLIYPNASPNLGHQFISDLEKKGKEVTVITQNIDGLHHDAGSTNILELHGTVRNNYCQDCGKEYLLEDLVRDEEGIPRCSVDHGIVRPDIVLYEEGLDQTVLEKSIQAIQQADLLIIAGTSLVVYPAAGLVNYFQGDQLVVINKTPIQVRDNHALIFEDTIENVFSQIK